MSIKPDCKNRIKPKLLREMKTEALLVFIRTTLEDTFSNMENNGSNLIIGTKKDTDYIYGVLNSLLLNLQDCVVNSTYLRSIIALSKKKKVFISLAKKEEALMVYYDALVKCIGRKLPQGTPWIPELVVISLLSEWIIEEEKSVYLYPFLKELNYLELINCYDKVRLSLPEDERKTILDMYRLSSSLIIALKTVNYKVNTKRKSKRKKTNT